MTIAVLIMILLTTGCAIVTPAQSAVNNQSNHLTESPTDGQPDAAPTSSLSSAPIETVASRNVGLIWAGSILPTGEKGETCNSLTLTIDNRALLGLCDGTPAEIELFANQAQEWPELLARFAPFEKETPDERLDFRGTGDIGGPTWERAITFWARITAAELASERVSATGRTILAWNLGQVPDRSDTCQRLIVLAYGYATAGLTRCEGGQMEVIGSGWLDTAQWEQFDAWLYKNAPFYQNDSYLDGRGTTQMSDAEAAALRGWTEAVYANLTQLGHIANEAPIPSATPPARCLTPNEDQQLLLDEAHGYCLLYPAAYSLVQTNPNSLELVIDSVMNHLDPRVSIGVEDAAGRSLEEVSRKMEADYALPGFNVERSDITVDGVQAVMFDHLPGQDLNRRVAFLQNGRLYTLFFAPIGDEDSETRRQAEALYQQVLTSFRVLNVTIPTPTP
jgi:hypothetical protein